MSCLISHQSKKITVFGSEETWSVHQMVFLQCYFFLQKLLKVQWQPLSVITSGQSKTDNINRVITITGYFCGNEGNEARKI
jgi:hypothetical protein